MVSATKARSAGPSFGLFRKKFRNAASAGKSSGSTARSAAIVISRCDGVRRNRLLNGSSSSKISNSGGRRESGWKTLGRWKDQRCEVGLNVLLETALLDTARWSFVADFCHHLIGHDTHFFMGDDAHRQHMVIHGEPYLFVARAFVILIRLLRQNDGFKLAHRSLQRF